jgi:flagellar basal-body rod modification protein FlgD
MPTATPITTASAPQGAGTQSTGQPGMLGKDDFLKLLVGQLRNQNPSDPTDSSQFMGQMTQFSILEQLTNIAATQEKTRVTTTMDQAAGLVGRTVTWTGPGGAEKTGEVEKVAVADGKPLLVVGSDRVDPARLTEVR